MMVLLARADDGDAARAGAAGPATAGGDGAVVNQLPKLNDDDDDADEDDAC